MESQLPKMNVKTKMPEVKPAKPIYTKEMHERGEFEIGMIYLNEDSQKCELVGINHNKFIGNIVEIPTKQYHLDISLIEDCKPIQTIEDDLVDDIVDHFNAEFGHFKDLAVKLIDKYNITPKGE